MRRSRSRAIAAVLGLVTLAGTMRAQPNPMVGQPPIPLALTSRPPATSVTQHTGIFGGQAIRYSAIVEEHVLNGPDSVPNASLVTIAYLRDSVAEPAKRPVMFVFNGGPGSSSSPLHMRGLGPRLNSPDGTGTVDNPDSILDAVDLVFIDPVGTGFSRPYTTEAGRAFYWSQTGDATSVAIAIEHWLSAHDRVRSPRYLAGESYGTARAGYIMSIRPQLRFDGVLLVSVYNGAEQSGYVMPYVLSLPTMATSAWQHNRIARAGRSVEQVYRDAVNFARTDFLVALAQGDVLSAPERNRVARRLSALVGVPVPVLIAKRLRLSNDDWMMHVLRDKGLRTGMLDTRVTSKLDTTRTGGLNDPSFNGGMMRIGTAMLAPAVVPGTAQSQPALPDSTAPPSALETYLRRDLGFRTLESYRSLNLDINGVWNYEDRADAIASIAAAMKQNTSMKLFWTGGYYDLTTPVFGAEYSFHQLGVDPARTTRVVLAGAHSVFADSANRRVLADRLRAWVR